MLITEWMLCPFETPGMELWMRNTPTNHGLVIRHPSLGGPIADETEFSSRRWSVVKRINDIFYLEIGSIAYTEGFDSFNEPEEIFKKYVNGEFQVLLAAPLADTVGMTDVSDWDGMSQSMRI